MALWAGLIVAVGGMGTLRKSVKRCL